MDEIKDWSAWPSVNLDNAHAAQQRAKNKLKEGQTVREQYTNRTANGAVEWPDKPGKQIGLETIPSEEIKRREIDIAIGELNQAIDILRKAVESIHERTKAVQGGEYPEICASPPKRQFVSPLANVISNQIDAITAATFGLSELENRIEL